VAGPTLCKANPQKLVILTHFLKATGAVDAPTFLSFSCVWLLLLVVILPRTSPGMIGVLQCRNSQSSVPAYKLVTL